MARRPKDTFQPDTLAEWRRWLEAHHARPEGVWLVTWKKATGKPHIEYGAAVEEAICFGWIDSTVNKLDAERSMLWFAPRRPRTGWSRANKERVARLLAGGRLHPAGMARIEQAKQDGSWSALDAVEDLQVPPDLRDALAAYPHAAANFERFPRSAKRGILEWIQVAKRPETRAARIAETARLADADQRANAWRPKPAG
jgi:uncharacterized protein YdeI (YjbR/CyaY-like superfamily)